MSDNITTYIDKEAGISRLRGNIAAYCRMLQLFLDSKNFAQMEEALSANNIAAAADAAHTIKGVAGNLSLTKLFDVSHNLNRALREQPDASAQIAEYRETLELTKKYAAQTLEELSQGA